MGADLFLAACILVVAWLGVRRARILEEDPRFEETPPLAAGLEELEVRLATAERREAAMESEGAEELARLRSGVADLTARLEALQRTVVELSARPPDDSPVPVVDAPTLVRHLERLGYERVRVVAPVAADEDGSPEPEAASEADASVRRWIVEVRRKGMTFKGRVVSRNGVVEPLGLTPGVHVFP